MDDRRTFMPKLEAVLRRIETSSGGLRRAFGAVQADRYTPTFDHCVTVIGDFVERHRQAAWT